MMVVVWHRQVFVCVHRHRQKKTRDISKDEKGQPVHSIQQADLRVFDGAGLSVGHLVHSSQSVGCLILPISTVLPQFDCPLSNSGLYLCNIVLLGARHVVRLEVPMVSICSLGEGVLVVCVG
jgi:hypothetical protein